MEETLKTNGQVVGFIDVGTNSVRLLVVRINPNLSTTVISEEKEVVRLGEQEFKDNLLRPEAMRRTVLVCRKFVELAKTYGATEIIAVGTSAIREALNQAEFLWQLKAEAGINVHVISGREEARLIYLGVSSSVDIGEEKAIFIDLGGGSTEIAIGNQYKCCYLDSLKFGTIRLTTKFIGEGWTGPVPIHVYEHIKRYVRSNMLRTTARAKESGAKLAFGSSGTIINLAEITSRKFQKTDNGRNLVLKRKNLKKIVPILCSSSLSERREIRGINPERADIIIAGAAIIETLMEEFELDDIIVSYKGLRDGLLVDYMSKFKGFQDFQKTPVRNRSVLQLGRSFDFDEKHSEIVAILATQLFDSGKEAGLHDLGDEERELLRYAATLHDVGDFLSFNDHHLHAHYIISNAELLGFDQREIAIMANLARFHRKKFPTKKALKGTGFDERTQEIVIKLSVFLRLAEKLDRSHRGLVKKAELSEVGKDRVLLSLYSDEDCSMEEWSAVQNAEAFYAAFDKKLDVYCVKPGRLNLEDIEKPRAG
jgi:exopolyphosphatase/guanosine-5'-triphosphate,3'-diphosphate pyrophosphatase